MRHTGHEPTLLFLGDILVLYLSLWLTLVVRYAGLPTSKLWMDHAVPFTLLFVVSVLVYFITGLYDQHTVLVRRKLPMLISIGQTATVVVAALFFFLIPYFGIAPKTNLAIFLLISSVLMVLWRLWWVRFSGVRKPRNALVLGHGEELDELVREIEGNPRYGLRIVHHAAPKDVLLSKELQAQLLEYLTKKNVSVVIAETRDPHMNEVVRVLYNLLFIRTDLTLVDAMRLYETIFRRIPVSKLEDAWFIEHITRQSRILYNLYHRSFDIIVSLVLGICSLPLYPIVAALIRWDDGGPIFSHQRRVGKDKKPLDLIKFRTMSIANDLGQWGARENRVTRVGEFLRKTRIDELPQLWNVLLGGYSLIGPRPEFEQAVARYAEAIPYYNARHLITPGLSGWAQLNHEVHPHHAVDIEETRNKLSYDLYYLKHRSFWLDLEIGLKTIKILLLAVGK